MKDRADAVGDRFGANGAQDDEGEPLTRYLARVGRLPVFQGLALAAQLLAALDALHRAGQKHSGISRDHLLVSRTGRLKVPGAEDEPASMPSGRAVTAAARGEKAGPQPDHRGDLLAATIVAYELLTGASPSEAGVRNASPRPVRAFRPELPIQLDAVFQRALARHPGDRYQTAAELSAALQAALPAPCWIRPALPAGPVRSEVLPPSVPPVDTATKVRTKAPADVRMRPTRGRKLGLALAVGCAAIAVLAATLVGESTPASPGQGRDTTAAAGIADTAQQQAAAPVGGSLSPGPSLETRAPASPGPDASPTAPQPELDRSAAMPASPDAEAGGRRASVSVPAVSRHEGRHERVRVAHREPRLQRIARLEPPGPDATCSHDLAIAAELCTAVRCATAEFRHHPVCLRMHAEGARARARLAESRGGP